MKGLGLVFQDFLEFFIFINFSMFCSCLNIAQIRIFRKYRKCRKIPNLSYVWGFIQVGEIKFFKIYFLKLVLTSSPGKTFGFVFKLNFWISRCTLLKISDFQIFGFLPHFLKDSLRKSLRKWVGMSENLIFDKLQ